MCGICGTTRAGVGRGLLAMNALLEHRGPDDQGVYVDPGSGVGIAARRLAIIDVQGGHQPLSNEDGSVWAVLNGEIYNHPQLQRSLREGGHRLQTRTDTEVLVHLYEEYGDHLPHALEGMYAFAIWDTRQKRLLLGRDRFGEKPLFYFARGRDLSFASELTSLLAGVCPTPDLDPAAVAGYFTYGYVSGPQTVFEGVEQLLPGHTLSWDRQSGRTEVVSYWSPSLAPTTGHSSEDLLAETEDILESAVRSRLVAEVPVGVFLSGGVDSTLVAALAARNTRHPVKTFAVGYDTGTVNETGPARHAAEMIGTDHHELTLTGSDVRVRVPRVLSALDQPIADQALVASHALAECARQEVTVAVGGEGADELFCGYPRYRWLQAAGRMHSTVPSGLMSVLARLSPQARSHRRLARVAQLLEPAPVQETNRRWMSCGRGELLPGLAGPALRAHTAQALRAHTEQARSARAAVGGSALDIEGPAAPAALAMWLDQTGWLADDILAKADRSSMLVSLEVRTPYLDRRLAEFANSLPIEVHCRRGGKPLLRGVLRRVLPEGGWSRGKTAFRVPSAEWLRGPLAYTLTTQLGSGAAFDEGWFERSAARHMVDDHLAGRADWSYALWPLLAFGLWLDRLRGTRRG
jgi:asparagine synthase (glutamine-hydrolysing)